MIDNTSLRGTLPIPGAIGINEAGSNLPDDIPMPGTKPWNRKPKSLDEYIRTEYGVTGKELLEHIKMAYHDTARLEFLYSLGRPSSKELIDIEFKLFNNTQVPMSEVREAIDRAMKGEK